LTISGPTLVKIFGKNDVVLAYVRMSSVYVEGQSGGYYGVNPDLPPIIRSTVGCQRDPGLRPPAIMDEAEKRLFECKVLRPGTPVAVYASPPTKADLIRVRPQGSTEAFFVPAGDVQDWKQATKIAPPPDRQPPLDASLGSGGGRGTNDTLDIEHYTKAVSSKIQSCWHSMGETGEAVLLVVQIDRDGKPTRAEATDAARYNTDRPYRGKAEAALRAVMDPRCQPWPLDPANHDTWKTLTLKFPL
jgi:hypothetical protein